MFDNIFGGSDDEDENTNTTEQHDTESEWDIEVSAHTGFTSSDGDDGSASSGWFRTHTITLDLESESEPTSDSASVPAQPTVPDDPTPSPETDIGSDERGTFVFPQRRDFMQKVEARGLNGAHDRVETVYVLAGNSYTTPTDLFRLDDPSYYESATRRSVVSYSQQMAEKVAALYPDGTTPNLLVRFHTHPGGSTRPSDADKKSAAQIRDTFVDAFGTQDFEFFHGIHAYKEHGDDPAPAERHSPVARSNSVSWRGEQYRHELALFGPKFQNPRNAVVRDD